MKDGRQHEERVVPGLEEMYEDRPPYPKSPAGGWIEATLNDAVCET